MGTNRIEFKRELADDLDIKRGNCIIARTIISKYHSV